MVDEDAYCVDILTQVSAVNRALQSVAVGLLDEHVRHCVRDAAPAPGLRALGEARTAGVTTPLHHHQTIIQWGSASPMFSHR